MSENNVSENKMLEVVSKMNMEFESEELAYEFYNRYVGIVGFSVRKNFVNKSKIDGRVMSRRYVCYKNGFREQDKCSMEVKRPQKEVRTGCLAHMTISYQANGKYKVIHFEANHNHEFVPQEQAHMLPSQRKLTRVQAIEANLADDSGIPPKSSFELMSKQVGGRENIGYLMVDYKNYLRSKRMADMKEGEATMLMNYFQKQQLENPSFFYAVQLDVDGLITNVFWADARMVLDYGYFGDVVCFDTTYKTNNLSRPLASFVGLNHHRKNVLFGAAFMYDEIFESFQWLFDTFVQVMSSRRPVTIITDQDQAMAKAIKDVLPETNHRLCIWHLWENAKKHLGRHFHAHKTLAKEMSHYINDILDENEFLQAWEAMVAKYDLQENTWLAITFDNREKLAMAFRKKTFSAGMKSTQLSESFNRQLKKYLTSELNLARFLNDFERVVAELHYNEVQSNYDMSQRIPIMKVNTTMLRHARDIYTPNVFKEFQEEFGKFYDLVIKDCTENESFGEYKVIVFGECQEHYVKYNFVDNSVCCSCMKFEFWGILCCHLIKVLDSKNVKVVPEPYCVKRWMKNAKVDSDVNGSIIVEDPNLAMKDRYRKLTQNAIKLTTLAAETEEGYASLNKIFNEAMLELEKILSRKIDETVFLNVEDGEKEQGFVDK